jgi:hypothetical protein
MRALALFLATLALVSCGQKKSPDTEIGNITKTIVPQVQGVSQHPNAENASDRYQSEDQMPKVPIKPEETLLHLININLDLDKTDEQILVLKSRTEPKLPIRIALVDYDEIRESYAKTWEHVIQATNPRAVRIETEDIIGDYNTEIICRGLNNQGELTLDVFRKTTSPSGLGLYYSPICQVSSDRRIKILREKRSDAYQLGQKYGQSFPIVVEKRDPDSENNLDVIMETYYWKYQEKRYIKSVVEKIPGDSLKQKQLQELFSAKSTKEDFEEFLKGPWFKQNEIENIVYFDPAYGIISFYDQNVLEAYQIEDFYLHGYRLSMIAKNSTIASIKRWLLITVHSMNSIEINASKGQYKTVVVNEKWEGKYNRLTSDLMESLLQTQKSFVKASPVDLSGIYRTDDGLEIAFEPPYFTWLEENPTESLPGGSAGGFSVIHNVPLLNGFYLEREIPARVDVITFRFISESGMATVDKTYVLEHEVEKDSNTVVKTINLTPTHLIVQGAVLTSKESVTLEQIEISQ